jgi:hypothetical protein
MTMRGEAPASRLVLRTILCDKTTGGAKDELGLPQPGYVGVVELVRSGGPLCRTRQPVACRRCLPDSPDVVPLARALMTAHVDRVVWGTDWPHPTEQPPGSMPQDSTPLLQIADGRPLHQRPMPALRMRRSAPLSSWTIRHGFLGCARGQGRRIGTPIAALPRMAYSPLSYRRGD